MKQIICRYQFVSKRGKKWTDWFRLMGEPVGTESECKDRIRLVVRSCSKDRSKLRHEYRIVEATSTGKEAAYEG